MVPRSHPAPTCTLGGVSCAAGLDDEQPASQDAVPMSTVPRTPNVVRCLAANFKKRTASLPPSGIQRKSLSQTNG
jgi:hypothetical protein